MDCNMPGLPIHHQLLEVYSNSCPLSQWYLPPISSSVVRSPPAFNLSQHQGLFQWVSSLHQVAKYWSFSFSIRSSNEYSGLISFRIDWLDLLAGQETLKSLLQHLSSKTSILWGSAFFIIQLLPSYMTTGKTIALTIRTFVSKVMSLLFNMLSRLVIAFFPRTHTVHLLYPFIHQWTLRLFPSSATINSATVNTGVHLLFWIMVWKNILKIIIYLTY